MAKSSDGDEREALHKSTSRANLDVWKLCVAIYVCLKLVEAISSNFDKYLTMQNHAEYKDFKKFMVALDIHRLWLHIPFTLAVPWCLERPSLLLGAFFVLACIVAIEFVATAINLSNGLPLLQTWVQILVFIKLALVTALDAVADTLARATGFYLQTARKIGAIMSGTLLAAQLSLSRDWCCFPMIILCVVAFVFIAIAAYMAWHLEGRKTDRQSERISKVDTKGNVPMNFATLSFVVAVLIGDNGEELNDEIANLEIDKNLAGGKRSAALMKQGIALFASLLSICAFAKSYRDRSKALEPEEQQKSNSREARWATAIVVAWGMFQMMRMSWVNAGALDALWSTAILILADKVIGSLASDSFGNLQQLVLVEMTYPLGTTSSPLTPHLLGSFAEAADKLSKKVMKRALLEEGSWIVANVGMLMRSLTMGAVICNGVMAFVIIRSVSLKRDPLLMTLTHAIRQGQRQLKIKKNVRVKEVCLSRMALQELVANANRCKLPSA